MIIAFLKKIVNIPLSLLFFIFHTLLAFVFIFTVCLLLITLTPFASILFVVTFLILINEQIRTTIKQKL